MANLEEHMVHAKEENIADPRVQRVSIDGRPKQHVEESLGLYFGRQQEI